MSTGELFIKTNLSIDDLAQELRLILNIPAVNQDPIIKYQRRDGINRGGLYYHFRVLGVDIELIQNAGEVLVEGREKWPFYIDVYTDSGTLDSEGTIHFTAHIAKVLEKAGFEVEVGDI